MEEDKSSGTSNIEVSIIVPVYNEEGSLRPLYDELKQAIQQIDRNSEIIFVNDGSKDNSEAVLNQLAEQDSMVKVIHLQTNFGQTAAIAAGLDHAQGDIIIPIDADLQNDPRDIPRLLDKLAEGYDVVSGWRKNRRDKWFNRTLPSLVANKLISIISGVKLHDYGCTLKAYRRKVIKDIKLYGEMHRFIPIYSAWYGAKVTEIVVNHRPRRFGKSKYGFERVIKVILDLIVIKFLGDYAHKPIYIFGGVGILSFILAFLSGLWALYLKFFHKISFIQTPLPLLFVLLIVLGFNAILLGLLAEISIRTYYESQNKHTYLVKEKRNFKQ
ncbi:glycosyltransferase [Candidatus Sumerlaeota bacterium]|nr:glycosyltransferase [Candidatus Sumerlaeota bacterium]